MNVTCDKPVVRIASLEEILTLRHAVLRPGLPLEAARFTEDTAADTFHFGAFDVAGQAISCVTLLRDHSENRIVYQLRGMATAPEHRNRGVGGLLLQLAEHHLQTHTSAVLIWCNARLAAHRFYLRHGWRIIDGPFDLPPAGPHYRMVRDLPR